MIQESRLKTLKGGDERSGRYVLYWMQASPRAECNHALESAIERANERGVPVVAFFGLTADWPEANARHYTFLLEGLQETARSLAERGIQLVVRRTSPGVGAVEMAGDAALVVVDRGYLRIQQEWYEHAAQRVDCPLLQVESNVVVPVETASDKEEYAAWTLRRKLEPLLPDYLVPLEVRAPQAKSLGMDLPSLSLDDIPALIDDLGIEGNVQPVNRYRGGRHRAQELLETFIAEKLDDYDALRNDPTTDHTSHMSPYLHFGQISPLQIALQVQAADSPGESAYLEELIVRRELGMNMVFYNRGYDDYSSVIPDWAIKTLDAHANDPREYVYTAEELEAGETHDSYWNAAQREMVATGKMSGYMRMYWGKKILEWAERPEDAFRLAQRLNDKYELDGRDPNGYAGVAWCFGKHDRPWPERKIFGTVRYMNANGLKRKFDADAYVRQVEELST